MFLLVQTELVSWFSGPKSHICPTVQQRGPKVPHLHLAPHMNSVHSTAASEKPGQWELRINYIRNYKGQHTLLVSTAATFPHLNSIYSSRPQTALPARTLLWRLHWRTGCAQVPLFTSNPTKWALVPLAASDATDQWERRSLIWAPPRRAGTQQPFTVSRVNNLLARLVTHNLPFCTYFCVSHLRQKHWKERSFRTRSQQTETAVPVSKVQQGHRHDPDEIRCILMGVSYQMRSMTSWPW